jgi:lipid II:glycine glycyltransferase (peptidoglycan interpeptide bridge formation enzyme)
MTRTTQTTVEKQVQTDWDDRIASSSQGHLLQSWAWGELKSEFGWTAERVDDGPACAQVLFRSLPAGLGSMAYIPKGPVVDFHDEAALKSLLAALGPLAEKERALCLKIEPNLDDEPWLAERLCAHGFKLSPQEIQPRRTILVDLDAEPDDLLKRMKQKTRYNIRLAGRRGVTVRPANDKDLPDVYDLMKLTAERDGFGIHSPYYYETAYRRFVPAGQGALLVAEHEGRLLAALMAFAFGGTAIYMYGASSNEGRKRMPTYLLQWEAMLWAKKQGCVVYDLWGVPDEDEESLEAGFTQRSDGLWGVYRFKRGFGGSLTRSAGTWDLVYSPLRYQLYKAGLRLQSPLSRFLGGWGTG